MSIAPFSGLKMGSVVCFEGITGPYAKDVANERDTFWHIGGEGQGGLLAQRVNRMESALGWDEAVCKNSSIRAEDRGGARVGKPRWVRILTITAA